MPTNTNPLLELRSISKSFGGLTALKQVSLTVAPGEICGVIGPNGAGKSTLFSVIAGSLAPSDGSVIYDKKDVTSVPMYKRARIGIVRTFQLAHTFDSMTVEDNVLIGAEDHSRLNLIEAMTHLGSFRNHIAAARRKASKAVDIIGLNELVDKSVAQLTFGQQRLVATGRAIASQPRLLLLDEPAAGLSGGDIDAMSRSILNARDGGATVLIVEHNMDVILQLCEHIIVMHLGEKIGDGSTETVRQSERVVEAYLGA
jgi:branched-chain amino acid transport system ATP-binding protein